MGKRFLVIQTAFIGDAILATALLEELHLNYPDAQVDLLVRKGNEPLFEKHPFIHSLYVWDKSGSKVKNLYGIISQIRKIRYDRVINLHRFMSSGIITAFTRAKEKAGFNKNPLSAFYTIKKEHVIGDGRHEVERNAELISDISAKRVHRPKIYPLDDHFQNLVKYKKHAYICLAPTSVWFTKQLPKDKWLNLLTHLKDKYSVYLLGAPGDRDACEEIAKYFTNGKVFNLAGRLNLLESAALMKDAVMNYVNDSAPMHLASAVNAPVTAVFCSTVPAFGFGPLSDKSHLVEVNESLDCRPCGLHGYSKCPEGHFKCAKNITIDQLIEPLKYYED
ncbi:MAG: glycosyltransferase family 9 protein [Bacteroidales bacterium]|nr:glycosyltransferase family 9 protein [Bacteroidales bacterium]